MKYAELTYAVAAEHAEEASHVLVEAGATGIEERDHITIERPEPGRVILVVWIDPDEVDAYIERVAVALPAVRPVRFDRDEDEWRDAWKRYFHARPVGRFVIVPSWEKYEHADGEIVLDLDPGRAFGTGGHASTRLCLHAIDQLSGDVSTILDVGCGSGVLAIAAAKRWTSARGEGMDIDPDAVEVSVENAQRNGVDDRLTFSTIHPTVPADLVFANIQPEVLIPMAAQLIALRKKTLVLAGIIDPAAQSVIDAYAQLGEPKILREEGWTALVYGA